MNRAGMQNCITIVAIVSCAICGQDIPVFPGAEGFGTLTAAGRAGDIIRVTNLNPTGPDSFHEAVTSEGRRTVVFEVGGIIDMRSLGGQIRIRNPHMTIAGQTAPRPGITLLGYGLHISTHDILVQHLAIRIGDHDGPGGSGRHCFYVDGSRSNHAANVVIDHCSMTWSTNKNISTWTNGDDYTHDITVSNCIISECLNCSGYHYEGCHSKGFLLGDFCRRVTMKTTLLSHNFDRNPSMKGGSESQIVNNVVYNPEYVAMVCTGSSYDGDTLVKASVVGNVLKAGPTTHLHYGALLGFELVNNLDSRFYVADNQGSANYYAPNLLYPTHKPEQAPAQCFVNTPEEAVWTEPMTVIPTDQVMDHVLANCGYRPAQSDYIDQRIVNDVVNTTGGIIDHISEVGGYPDFPPTQREFIVPNNPDADDDDDGYTNLEEILHEMAADVEFPGRVAVRNYRELEKLQRPSNAFTIHKRGMRLEFECKNQRDAPALLFSANGTMLGRTKPDASGKYSLPLSRIQPGYYIVLIKSGDNVPGQRTAYMHVQ
ncbi:MAG: hypothetical protein GF350_14315 [Chitinivibrionales bacterium]|nr:hypothetical protein [Chitinivibrionales bacterium]